MPEGFHLEEDERTLAQVIDVAVKSKADPDGSADALSPPFEAFLTQAVRYATGEDRNWDEPTSLLDRAVAVWALSAERRPGEHIIRIETEEADDWRGRRLVLDIVTDDRPFLVDSISGALTEAGKPVSFFLNAVVDTGRDEKGRRTMSAGDIVRESMIRAEMDPAVNEAEAQALRDEVERVLNDVAIAVEDWEAMRARLGGCVAQLERSRPTHVRRENLEEAVEFLKWLWDNRFAFLGVRRFNYRNEDGAATFARDEKLDLGILRDPERRVLKSTFSDGGQLSPAVEDFLRSDEPILVAKANARSHVHRRVHMDYVGVKIFALSGDVVGEERFVGLFTAEAYNRPASTIPLLRAKVRNVLSVADFAPGGHNEKALVNILETYPRDEMFQVDVQTLAETAHGILRLYKRPRVKLFVRRDRFDRFIAALVFIPRDRFNSTVRAQIGAYLAETFDGRVAAFYPTFGDATLVRVQFIIALEPGAPDGPGITEMTREIRTICREWRDDLLDATRRNADLPTTVFRRYEDAFDASYREHTPPEEALRDIAFMSAAPDEDRRTRVSRRQEDAPCTVRIKLYSTNGPVSLSQLIPTIENLGLRVHHEAAYPVTPEDAPETWIHDFHTEQRDGAEVDVDAVKPILENAIAAVMAGRTEDDAFNALVLLAQLNWREAWLMRAAARHHTLSGLAFSSAYIAETLAAHPTLTRDLVAYFHARFNPAGPKTMSAREKEADAAREKIVAGLDAVTSLDQDRIIRRYLRLFTATTRTNYFQTDADGAPKAWVSFKIESGKIAGLPDPKPYREIFVSSPRVDGVHLRFGPVARGGLRWSDRREDFRTEVLGLVKAQRVKNAVIVPAGSKGGFYPKKLPAGGDRTAIYEEGRAAYKVFIRGMLDVTDNLQGGEVVPPPDVVRWDADDPYLVVAADKGTASFSDTANEIAIEYGYWLGDGFASGGSAGYDHKVMGITARGAWEAVKRHFREIGKDIQSEAFTVAGVGDMSGDVFGNGMLLSRHIRLVAAFDHRDIFIDPNPDAETSFAERERMFGLKRSSWADYDKALISKGGGVFSRKSKSIAISAEMRKLLGLTEKRLPPNDLIKAILRAPVELFWLGGIGTYFKGDGEEDWRVGDRANDLVRVTASEIRASVIGEGANLGVTQTARIEFAARGGRVNTDAIDNSAGVDSSDHEVNIKILLSKAIENGALEADARNALLEEMTDAVARHVLAHNYQQTRALSQRLATAPADLDSQARLMAVLEKTERLDRALENLPDTEAIATLRGRNQGLTRPEISVLLAYAKNWLFEELVASSAPDDPVFERELFAYFPERLAEFRTEIATHPLRREIIATRIANDIVDSCGPSFPYRAADATGADFGEITLAYEAARRILDLRPFVAAVDGLDNKIDATCQLDLYNAASTLLREQMYRIAAGVNTGAVLEKEGVSGFLEAYGGPVSEIKTGLADVLPPRARKTLDERRAQWIELGAPDDVGVEAALMPSLELVFDVANLSRETGWAPIDAAAMFFAVGEALSIDVVRAAARDLPRADYYDKMALRRLAEDLATRQSGLTASLIEGGEAPSGAPGEWTSTLIGDWRDAHSAQFERYDRFIVELEIERGMSVGKLSLLNRKLVDLEERVRLV